MGSHQILCYFIVTKNWSSSDPDPKLILTNPDLANNFGSERIRIHNTGFAKLNFFAQNLAISEEYGTYLPQAEKEGEEEGDMAVPECAANEEIPRVANLAELDFHEEYFLKVVPCPTLGTYM